MTSFQWIGLVFLIAIINDVFSIVNIEVSNDVMKHTTVKYPITGTTYEFRIAAISDLEKKSKSLLGPNVWSTYLKKGCLIYNSNSQAISVNWDSGLEKGEIHYTNNSNVDGRGFEMSEMVTFYGQLLAADDETGILYKYDKGDFVYWHIVPANNEGAQGQSPSEHGQGEKNSNTHKESNVELSISSEHAVSSSEVSPPGQSIEGGNLKLSASSEHTDSSSEFASPGQSIELVNEHETIEAKISSENTSQPPQEMKEHSDRWSRININDELEALKKKTSENTGANSAVTAQGQSAASSQQDHGNHKLKKIIAMNIEWATVKDGSLFVGPNGIGQSKFVAIINRNKQITFEDWSKNFDKIKDVAGIKKDGYMTFESCEWSKEQNKFFFLPKTASNSAYDRIKDRQQGLNLIMSASPDFKEVQKEGNITEVYTDRGYSSFKFLPYTKDQVIVALQTSEITNETHIIAFNTNGSVLYKPTKVADIKFEGFEFV
ncbi:Hypothetical protein CINCED_3A017523 [Cinara cedri]|nr:Hypothetical protein CINCED_3A017523 [Cinara cedri]